MNKPHFFNQHRDDPEVAEKLTHAYEKWNGELRYLFELLQDGSWIDRSQDAAVLSTQVLAFAEGLMSHTRVFHIDAARYREALVEGVLRLLGGS